MNLPFQSIHRKNRFFPPLLCENSNTLEYLRIFISRKHQIKIKENFLKKLQKSFVLLHAKERIEQYKCKCKCCRANPKACKQKSSKRPILFHLPPHSAAPYAILKERVLQRVKELLETLQSVVYRSAVGRRAGENCLS